MSYKTDSIELYLSSLETMDKWKNDNINYDIIDKEITELNITSGISETVNIYNSIELIGALDTDIQFIVMNGQTIKNPLYKQTIREILICESVSFKGLNHSHFGTSKEITLPRKLSKLYSLDTKQVDFDGFRVITASNMCIRNLKLLNVNGMLLTGSSIVMVNIEFNTLMNSIEGTYHAFFGNEYDGSSLDLLGSRNNTTNLRNITIKGFSDEISLFKNISNLTNISVVLTNEETNYENIIFECVSNVKNCTIEYVDSYNSFKEFNRISLTGKAFREAPYKYKGQVYTRFMEGKGLYNSSNIKTIRAGISLKTPSYRLDGGMLRFSHSLYTLMFLSNLDLNICGQGGTFEYCNNINITLYISSVDFIDCINSKVGD